MRFPSAQAFDNPFPEPTVLPLAIHHGNTDIELSMVGASQELHEPPILPGADELVDPELLLAAQGYRLVLRSMPLPDPIDYEDPSPADWDDARDRAIANGGPF